MLLYMCATLFGATLTDEPVDAYSVIPLIEEYEPEQLFQSLMRVAEAQYAERAKALSALDGAEAWRGRQRYVRETLIDMMGGMPERTPLNARVVGSLEREGYRVENVIFESRPEFYVTANVYVPTVGPGPYPALVSPCGHSENGKAYDGYQRAYIAAAKQGYVVLAYDPISQGERLQILDETGASVVGAGTGEHCHQGNQGTLIGLNLAQIRVWDGIRSLDSWRRGQTSTPTGLASWETRVAGRSPRTYAPSIRESRWGRRTATSRRYCAASTRASRRTPSRTSPPRSRAASTTRTCCR